MDRRNFIGNLLTATAGFFLLPGAGRLWKPQGIVPVRLEFNADTLFNAREFHGKWQFVMDDLDHQQPGIGRFIADYSFAVKIES